MNMTLRHTAAAAALLAASGAFAAAGDTWTYNFNAPSTGGGMESISQAVLLLTETTSGVDFVLSPNWAETYGTFVQQLVFAYSGDTFTYVDGAGPDALSVGTDSGSIDSGYNTAAIIEMKWPTSGGDKFDSAFASSAWSLNGSGVTLDDFMVLATSPSKPSPAFGVISLPGARPSNWVAGEGQTPAVPEPGTYGLMALGLGFMGVALRRRRSTQ